LILERVRVHGAEGEAAGGRVVLQHARVRGPVPGDVQRDLGRRAHERLHGGAVVELLEHVAWLAGAGEAREARAAGADPPRGQCDAQRLGAADQRLDVDAAPPELAAQVLEVGVEVGAQGGAVVGHEARFDREGVHARSIRG
jgi:hypothetical protein